MILLVCLFVTVDPAAAVRSHKRFLVDQREQEDDMPSDPDELFYRELLFARNEQQIMGE